MSDGIQDGAGDELTYVPITGLIEDSDSQEVPFQMTTPRSGYLTCNDDSRLDVFVKEVGGVYVNIVDSPIDLSLFAPGTTHFLVYAHALSPIVGLERIPISVVAGTKTAAGWTL